MRTLLWGLFLLCGCADPDAGLQDHYHPDAAPIDAACHRIYRQDGTSYQICEKPSLTIR